MSLIPFTHLHVHSQYSILDGQASISNLVSKAVSDGMTSIALTDHGTMLGVKDFFDTCRKKGIKPILGCETYVAQRTINDRTEKADRSGRHLILLAKNMTGYRNLLKLISIANLEGFFYRPRIDKQLLEQYKDGLIVASACLGGEISQKIMNGQLDEAREAILWYKELFGDDYYLELQRLPSTNQRMREDIYDRQVIVNEKLLEFSKELGVKVIATNDVHFTDEDMAEAHDILICLNTGKDVNDENRMRYTQQEWFKTTEEMNRLFADVPESLANTQEIADKIESFNIDSDPIMPEFPIPEEFGTIEAYRAEHPEANLREEFGDKQYDILGGDYEHILRIKFESDYLKHLTYEGAKSKYGDPIAPEAKERIDFELNTITTMGFPGYFLIVQDFINEARKMGVLVGPGRGSAAGSAVAYCVGITLIDPIKHDLLFERFLNPDRISMPDVDIDFDDDGRQLVLEYVANKYGNDKVAHICTLGTMAAKSAIKDVGRVLKLPLAETDRISKRIPERPGTKLASAYNEVMKLENETGSIAKAIEAIAKKIKDTKDEKAAAKLEVQLIFAEEIQTGRNERNDILLKTLRLACDLEGSIRQTGVHACGVLIGRDSLSENIPLMPAKEGVGLKVVTQYEGTLVESIGLLKMDFLGLRTLSIIKEALDAIKLSKGIDINLDEISYDDKKTFDLFSNGETTAIFQFESPGMKKHLKGLQPNRFEDLVAMNALYRPGPMEYIPKYIERKHGRDAVEFDHPIMEGQLKDTYGITVFQEQVMLLSRELGQFTRGESDTLRKAMGKKQIEQMNKLKKKFDEGCKSNEKFMQGCKDINKKPDDLIEKIWKDWEAFASYAFNKSHSVCYANLAYQTAYLKANYPAEFMAGVLSRNLNDITKISVFMDECRRMKIEVLGPDINESLSKFTVNKLGALRFGMAAIKGVGEGAVEEIINERNKNGVFTDIYNLVERVNLQSVNKKAIEALAIAGAFDGLGNTHRAQYFAPHPTEDGTFIERLLKYGNRYQIDKASTQNTLFGALSMEVEIKKPDIPVCLPFTSIEKLEKEKELIGMFLSAHPLDDYKLELKSFCNKQLKSFENLPALLGHEFTVGGMVVKIRKGRTREKDNPFGIFTLEDYSGSFEFALFGEDYTQFSNFLEDGLFLLVKGRVQARKYNQEQLDAKITSISLLSEVLEKHVRNATVKIPLQEINEDVVYNLIEIVNNNQGNIFLRFQIFDSENERLNVKLLSRNARVNITPELVEFFEMYPEISLNLS